MTKPDDLRKDFRAFLDAIWQENDLPLPTEVQLDIAQYLQHGPATRGVMAQRGEGKTWITTAYILWRLYVNPNERILLVSESANHARKTLKLVRLWIEKHKWLNYLLPKKGVKQRDGIEALDVGPSKEDRIPSVTALGITGQIVGNRATVIVPDDIETDETVLTINARERLKEKVAEFANVLLPGGDVVILGTYHHEASVYHHLEETGYEFRHWPGRYPATHERTDQLAPFLSDRLIAEPTLVGKSTSPGRFSEEYLDDKKLKIGNAGFAMQYMLRTDLTDYERCPLKLRDLVVYPCARNSAPVEVHWGMTNNRGSTALDDLPAVGFAGDCYHGPIFVSDERERYYGTKMVVDPAGGAGKEQTQRSKQRHDETAWAIISQLYGNLFLKCVGAYSGGHDVPNLMKIVQAAKLHGVNEIHIEKNFGGELLGELIKPLLKREFSQPRPGMDEGWACRVESFHRTKHDGHKEQRIVSIMDPILLQHRLIVDPAVACDTTWSHQLTHITMQKGCLDHDDRIDATAECVRLFQDVLSQDPEKAAQRYAQEHGQEELNTWVREYDEQEETSTPLKWATPW